MEDWARAVTPETYVKRNLKVYTGSSTIYGEAMFWVGMGRGRGEKGRGRGKSWFRLFQGGKGSRRNVLADRTKK